MSLLQVNRLSASLCLCLSPSLPLSLCLSLHTELPTVCFGIDRDGDGEITYAEFGKFSEELGNQYTVAKLRYAIRTLTASPANSPHKSTKSLFA